MVYIAAVCVGSFFFWLIFILPCKIYKARKQRKEDLQRWKSEMNGVVQCGSADSPEAVVPMPGAWRAVNSTITTNSLQDDRPDLTYEYQFQFLSDGTVRGRGRLCPDENAVEALFNLSGKYNATTREVVWCESFVNQNVFGGEKLVKGTFEESQMRGTWLLADGYSGTFVMQQVGVFQEPPSAAQAERMRQLEEAIEMGTPIRYQATPGGPVVNAKISWA
jgi:hypothetical protein